MLKKYLIPAMVMAVSSPAFAQNSSNANDGAERGRPWTIGLSGGATFIEGQGNQPFVSLSINREIGDSYLGLAATLVDAGEGAGLINSVPVSTQQFTLSGGTSFGPVTLDGYIAVGKRKFETEALEREGRTVQVNSDGDSFGTGLALGYDFPIGMHSFLSPSIAVDYNKLDIGRTAMLPSGNLLALADEEDGVTGTAGLSYQYLLGENYEHSVGVYGAFVATSNTTSFNPGNSPQALTQFLALRNVPGQGGSWGEIGGSASFGLTDGFRLNISAVQTIGFPGPDATSVSAGISASF